MSRGDRIRVLQFLTSTVRAGAEEVALELARGLDPVRYRSYLACPPELMGLLEPELLDAGVECVPIAPRAPWSFRAALKFVRYLREQRIQVFHAHMIRAAVAGVPLARLAGVPVVIHTCHGREAWRTSWHSRHFVLDRWIHALADKAIAVSQSTSDYLVQEKKFDPDSVVVIRNGRPIPAGPCPPSKLEKVRKELGITDDHLVIGVFGRLEEQKGHRYLLAALPEVFSAIPAVTVLCVGDGVLRPALEAAVSKMGFLGRVRFLGFRNDVRELMTISDIVALPSLYEGMPLVPIEAAAVARPVVATAVDGTREVVVDGVTGRLVPPEAPAPLARALIDLLRDPAERKRLSENAYAHASAVFSLDRQIQSTTQIYESGLAKVGLNPQRAVA